MSSESNIKLNRLLANWNNSTVGTTKWLKSKGFYQQLVDKYEKSGWLTRVGQGAYKRAGDKIEWSDGLKAIQGQLEKKVHVASKSALEKLGVNQYLNLGNKPKLTLYGKKGVSLPKWFKEYEWKVEVKFHTSTLFKNYELGLTTVEISNEEIKISSRERAILELLEKVDDEHSFQEAVDFYEGLSSLRSKVVQELLEDCNSIKVKRIFLYLTQLLNMQLFQKLKISKLDLGKGKRSIVKNGHLDNHYLITVPLLFEVNRDKGNLF